MKEKEEKEIPDIPEFNNNTTFLEIIELFLAEINKYEKSKRD